MKADKVYLDNVSEEVSEVMTLIVGRLDESAKRDYSKLDGFSEIIKGILSTSVSCVYGKVYLTSISPRQIKAEAKNIELLPLMPKDSSGRYLNWGLVVKTTNPDGSEEIIALDIFPSRTNSKRVWVWLQDELCLICFEEGRKPLLLVEDEIKVRGITSEVITGAIGVLRAFLTHRKREWVEQQPTLKHSNERKQWKAFTEAVAKEGALLGPSYEYSREPTGGTRTRSSGYTVAAHDREAHKRVYRNPDGTVRKVVDVKGSKVHGGAAAGRNTSLIIVK